MEHSIPQAHETSHDRLRTPTDSLLRMMTSDFIAVLVAYNMPADEAKQVSSEIIESVREHYVGTGIILRRVRL